MPNSVRRLALALVALAAAPAAAQPGADLPPPDVIVIAPGPVPGPAPIAPPAAPPAPQTHDWSAVSHINGHPVPVGETGHYLKTEWKKTNIASNPIGWMIGFYGVSVSHAVSDNLAFRGDVNLFDDPNSSQRGYEIGASLPIYFRRVYSGPFIEPGLIIRDGDQDDTRAASVGPSVVFGWHWTFDSGFNVAVAFGLMRNLTTQRMDTYYDDDDVQPSGYFRVGYAF
jgi:hypothetical protein